MSTTYPYWSARADPARRKGAYLAGTAPDYPSEAASYNRELYRPNDTRFQPGSPVQTGPGQYATPYGSASVRFVTPAQQNAANLSLYNAINPTGLGQMNTPVGGNQPFRYVPPAPTMGGLPGGVPRGTTMGSGGFSFGATANPMGNFIDVPSTVTRVSPTSTSPASYSAPSGGAATTGQTTALPPLGGAMNGGNAMQRWNQPQTTGAMPSISPQTRFFWATGRMDAHANESNPAANVGAIPGTFDPGGAHMPDRSFLPSPAAPVVAPHQDPANPANTYVPQQYQQPAAPTAGGFGFGATANPTS